MRTSSQISAIISQELNSALFALSNRPRRRSHRFQHTAQRTRCSWLKFDIRMNHPGDHSRHTVNALANGRSRQPVINATVSVTHPRIRH